MSGTHLGKTIRIDLEVVGQPGQWVEMTNPMWLRQRDLVAMSANANDPEAVAAWVAKLIHDWDVLDIDGLPVPSIKANAENIQELPIVVLRLIMETIANTLNVSLTTPTS